MQSLHAESCKTILRSGVIFGSMLFIAAPLTVAARAQQPIHIPQQLITYEENPRVSLPLIICWHGGKKNLYIQTEASDAGVAAQMGVNYVPQLANAIDAPGGAVDDIYVVTNSVQQDQYNILPSEPLPVGPKNADPNYTPLWRISQVTWNAGVKQVTITSEAQALKAQADGLVTIVKTRIVVNCPVIYTDAGGLLPKAVISLNDKDGGGKK